MGSNCQYGECASVCLESSESICCDTVQCGNGWSCSLTLGQCCPLENQAFCSTASLCYSPGDGETCCGPTVCPSGQTCASSGDSCCPSSQTTCVASWWLIPVSTSVATISTSVAASTTSSDSSTTLLTSSLQAILKTAVPSVATAPCFLNPSYTSAYTTPSWFTDLPSPAQAYYSSVNANSTGACVIQKPSPGLSAGAKGGIAGGAVAGAFVIVGIILWVLRKRMSASRSEHTVAGREIAVNTVTLAASDWKEGLGSEGWSGPSSPSSPGEWGAASGAEVGITFSAPTTEAPRAAGNQDVIMPLMVGGARDLREENNALIPVTYMPYRPPMSPTPSRHLSRRPIGSPPPGELAGGRNYHASEVDGWSSGDGAGSLRNNARFSTVSYELLGREVYDNAK